MKKILILHGWMHSGQRYYQLKNKLENEYKDEVSITLFEFPGFGDTKMLNLCKNILDYYVSILLIELKRTRFDYVIAHSMGGNVLLKALQKEKIDTIPILLSPAYRGIDVLKPFSCFSAVMPFFLNVMRKHKNAVTIFCIKCTALLTINKWSNIDELIVEDSFRADPVVAARLMKELIWDDWKIENIPLKCAFLIRGENDRIITKKKTKYLMQDLPSIKLIELEGIGHTAVTENFEELLSIIKMIID